MSSLALYAAVCAIFSGSALAAPVQDLGRHSYAVSYAFVSHGHFLIQPAAYSRSYGHYASLTYAPLPFVAVTGSAGANQLDVGAPRDGQTAGNAGQFDGGADVGVSAAIQFYTPYIARILRGAAGVTGEFLRSPAGDQKYEASVISPAGGVIMSVHPRFDLMLGAAAHLMSGVHSGPGLSRDIENDQLVRALGSVTAHASERGVYMTLRGASPVTGFSDVKDLLMRSSVGVRLGVIIRPGAESRNMWKRNSRYFPGTGRLRERQREMAEDLAGEGDDTRTDE